MTPDDSTSADTRFVLPADVVILPVEHLAASLRKQIPHAVGDLAVSRPRLRRPSQIVDEATAGLLTEFRQPSRIADAVARYSRERGTDPFATLEAGFDALRALMVGGILVPSHSDLAHAVEASLVPGQEIAGYEILELIHTLEDTELYRAKSAHDSQMVALKLARTSENASASNMLAREACVLRHLQGVSAPRLVRETQWDGRPVLAIEWRSGVPLTTAASRLRAERKSRHGLHRLCCDVLEAFCGLHGRSVVHGDVHPGNVLKGESVWVLDFGLSRLLTRGSPFADAPRSGVAFYYDPELARALLSEEMPPPATFASDQYALAVLLYAILTGHYPQDLTFDRHQLLTAVAEGPVVDSRHRGVCSWPEVEAVLSVALNKDPSARYPWLGDMLDALVRAAPPVASSAPRRRRDIVGKTVDKGGWDGSWFTGGLGRSPSASVYFGAAGLALFFSRASIVRDDPALLALADLWGMRAKMLDAGAFSIDNLRLDTAVAEVDEGGSLFHSAPGVHCVRVVIENARGDTRGMEAATGEFLQAASGDKWRRDLLLGSGGTMLAAALLHRDTRDPRLKTWVRQALAVGSAKEAPCVRGIAHGIDGVLYATMSACQHTGSALPSWIQGRVAQLAADPLPEEGGWCSGTAGVVFLWTMAHTLLGEERYLRLAEEAARHTWRHPSRDGSLCCGLAGRAFALLRYYQYTGERAWLERAQRLARIATSISEDERRPWSLYRGGVGIALLEAELEMPEAAAMPLFA
jgi:eukaryotic-like serine/threonine-protein kinase